MRKRWIIGGAACVVLAAGLFIGPHFARRVESTPHPAAEYVCKPGTYRALWWRTIINSHHMRAVESDTYPVLVIGDSVALGWARIDQNDIATSILTRRLGLPVGNISASSWGPPNQLGYVETFGLFDARVVVVLLSSHDAADVPGLAARDQPREAALIAVGELIEHIRDAGAVPVMALHLEQHEIGQGADPGHEALREVAESHGVRAVELRLPHAAYFDPVHPNATGQRMIADQLEPVIRELLDESRH